MQLNKKEVKRPKMFKDRLLEGKVIKKYYLKTDKYDKSGE